MDFKLHILLELLILYILVHFLGFLKQIVDFFFCEGPSDLRIHALTAVRGLTLQIEKIGKYSISAPEFFFLNPSAPALFMLMDLSK